MSIWLEDSKRLPNGQYQSSFGMDNAADVANLPPMSDKVAPGSDAFGADKTLAILDSTGVWRV
jgi:hypothetical protein